MHKCSAYCKRRRKCSGNTFITRCRFGFPRQVCENPKLNSVQESLKSRRRIYELPRSDSEVRVNDYNPLLLMLWKANMDIQFVAESSLALAHYVSGYVTKAERSNMQEIWEEVSESKSIYGRLWSFGIRSLRFRECGLYEASDLLLGDHLNEKSDTVKWIDVSMPHKRNRRLINHKVLQEIAKHNPDSEEIFEDNLIDTFYPQRPANLENVCLYDFVAYYDWQGKDDNGNRKYRKLTKPRLPNHKLFDSENEAQREDYYYSLLLLFTPFREESGLLLENETAEEAFHRLQNEDSLAHHAKLNKMLEAQSSIRKINEARQADGEQEMVSKEDDDPQLIGEAKNAMNKVFDMNVNSGDDLSLEDRINMLNADQRRVFDKIHNHLLHQQQHEANECSCEFKPLHMFLSGVAGTGKSFLIETIKALISSMWASDDLTCAITAPTGLAAFNVGGDTIHRVFQLPIEHEGKSATYWSLPKASDEVSMVSSLNLAYMHLRLEELFGTNEWFGSKNMLFVGDLLQLPPVNGNNVFEKITKKSLSFKLGCAPSVNIWRDTVVYEELTINERQKKDKEYSVMLDGVRRGCPTDETLRTLEQRVIDVSVADKFDELQKSGHTPVCLFPTRKACNDFNTQMLSYLPSEVHELVCTDEVDETAGTRKWNKKAAEQLEKLNNDCNRTAGLEAKLSLAVGARVMLRRNINTKRGLVNGAIGTVISIVPNRVTVQFDHVSQPFDVRMVKSRFMIMKNFFVYRRQFPLILAYAVTIHKCQGLSLDCAIVDLSDQIFSDGMAYVALSRVRSLSGLYLTAFDPKSIMASKSCLKEINRLRELYRKDLPLYILPPAPSTATKRKLSGSTVPDQPKAKKHIISKPKTSTNCAKPPKSDSQPHVTLSPSKKCSTRKQPTKRTAPESKPTSLSPPPSPKRPRLSTNPPSGTPDVQYVGTTYEELGANIDLPLPPDEWKLSAIQILAAYSGMSVHNNLSTPARVRRVRCGEIAPHIRDRVLGDGNCLFRAISKEITGTEENHTAVRLAALGYLCENPSLITYGAPTFHIDPCTDPVRRAQLQQEAVSRCISTHHMDRCGWGTDFEIMLLASLLTIQIFSRSTCGESREWVCFAPGFTRNRSACPYGIYVYNITNFHYDRVIPVLRPPQ